MAPRREEMNDVIMDDLSAAPHRPESIPDKITADKQNGSIHLELGSYKSLKIPLTMLGLTTSLYPLVFRFKVDPRMEGLPLLGSVIPILILCNIYVCFSLVWGPRYMANRAPIKLNNLKMVYNVVQVIVCSYIFVQVGRLAWFWDYSYTCQPIDTSSEGKPFELTRIVYLYYLTKILDLMDTVFFVLNKKWTHISLLHVFHHSVLVMGIFVGAKYMPGGHGTFIGLLNSFVHALMYGYYFLAALGPAVRPYLWWKKYITIIQMIQFVLVFLHALQVFFIDCPIPKQFQFWSCFYAVMFFYLFRDFYLHSYNKKPMVSEKLVAKSNDIHKTKSNGIQEVKANGTHDLKRSSVGKDISSGHREWKSE